MSIITDFLKLFKYDPETDGANTFNIKQCLNDNWDKIDAWASGIKTTIAGLVPGTRKINNKALSADITLTGDDIKTSGTDDTPIGDVLPVLGGATTPQAALAALGAGVRPNLLDNAIFIGGGSQQGGGHLPINQRGQTSYGGSSNVYTIDQWALSHSNMTVEINPDGVKLSTTSNDAYLCQIIENIDSLHGTITLSVLSKDMSTFATARIIVFYNDTVADISGDLTPLSMVTLNLDDYENIQRLEARVGNLTAFSTNLIAAKLEIGDTQTLAYQDDTGAWQLLPQPESDYATQLMKCLRYYEFVDANRAARVKPATATTLYIVYPFAVPKRTNPSLQIIELTSVLTAYNNGVSAGAVNITGATAEFGDYGATLILSGSFNTNYEYAIRVSKKLAITAEL